MAKCPRCDSEVESLLSITAEDMMKLDSAGEKAVGQVCPSCLSEIQPLLTGPRGGGILLAQEKAKEQNRLMMWKSRVNIIKKARSLMAAKMYPEAAVAYEKYLKVLELVFNLKKGTTLTPEHFKDTARTSEITVVTSVYWDLIRIYDSHEKYYERQQLAAKQLALFVRFTPIFPDIIKRAEAFARNAKNPSVIKSFLKTASDQRPRCFIATSAFNDPLCLEVLQLRIFRDFTLQKSAAGRIFISIYYIVSPPIAAILDKCESLKALTRLFLKLILRFITH